VREGQAIVRLPSGAEYEGWAVYDGNAVTVEGCLRHVEGAGETRTIRLGSAIVRTWPIESVAVVEWRP